MNAVGLLTCRRTRSARKWSVLTMIAMVVYTAGGPGFMPAVKAQTAPVGAGFNLDAGDLRFIYKQIVIAQAHAAGGALFGPDPDTQVNELRFPFGLRTVDGSFNHIQSGKETFGAADQVFPRLTTPLYQQAEQGTSYAQKKDTVIDSRPRTISNLIVDQTVSNPAAVLVAGDVTPDPLGTLPIPNVAPDVGLSAPFNTMLTFFGQFFDHGLDLLNKGGSGTVFVPLKSDDPLFVPGSQTNFMVLTRGTNLPGADGILGDPNPAAPDTSLDDIQEGTNQTTPFVDQNQTYTSHPSHQVFLRQYTRPLNAAGLPGRPVSTGKMIDGLIPGNIGNWGEVKAQAATMLGIRLQDADVFNVPLLATDPYGRFLRGANGFPQIVTALGPPLVAVEGNPAANLGLGVLVPANALRTGHGFLDDIAHRANPKSPAGTFLAADTDLAINVGPQPPGTYDDELLARHFVTGDGRGNENIALTAVHTIFHLEHNRLARQIGGEPGVPALIDTLLTPAEAAAWRAVDPASGWDFGERVFQAARFVTEMEYQHLVFEEFARKLVPSINPFIGDGINFQSDTNPAIVAEFAHQTYRLGHSMLTETISRTYEDGRTNDISLLNGFLNPLEFNNSGIPGAPPLTAAQAAGAIFQGGTRQVANEIDEFVTEAVRNRLVGLPLDLAVLNLSRGRSEGIPPLNEVRRQLYEATGNSILAPYQSWKDFEFSIRNPESVINYLAAYGTHQSIVAAPSVALKRAAATMLYNTNDPILFMLAEQSGVNDIDLWVGGLAERQSPFGGLLGSTFNVVFELQLENLQNADRFYYLERLDGLNLLAQMEANSFAELIARNTTAGSAFSADVFGRPDLIFNLASLLRVPGVISDDPSTPDDESTMPDLVLMPDGTVRYLGPAHVIWNGRNDGNVDRAFSSEGDDTLRGNGGNDVMEGGAGNDQHIGGAGDDILTDIFGEDVIKGGPGNDAISGGAGPFDLLQGNEGNDFIVAGNDVSETFGGPGNDIIYSGDGATEMFGGAGDDWIEGGPQLDLLVGDENNQFQDDPSGGHDVIIGGKGDDDYDSEGGDDIMVADVLGTERLEGMRGFDWVTYRGDALPVDADMNIRVVLPPNLDELRDRFDLAEALSGWKNNDILRGEDRVAADMVGHVLTPDGVARIAGLQALLGGATSFTGGNIILGGAGSDLIEGRGGNDLIDGDAWLNVQLEVGTTGRFADSLFAFRTEIFAGTLNPGLLEIRRSIVTGDANPGDIDTAVFSGPLAEYTITPNGDGTTTVAHTNPVGAIDDGIDTLRNIERLEFADQTVAVAANTLAVVLAFPDGGQRVFANVPTNITWSVRGATSIDVQLSTNGGTTFAPIPACTGLAGSAQQCAWTPVGPQVNNARVRVIARGAAGATATDSSAANFQISTLTPVIAVTAPDIAASWVVSATQNIRWTHNLGISAFVRIELSRDGGATWQTLNPSFKNTGGGSGVFPWVVTGPPTSAALVRVSWLDGPVSDASGTFTVVQPAITVTAPNTAVDWGIGGTRTITWRHSIPAGGRVNLDVSRDAGVTWTPIAIGVPNATNSVGNYNWVVSGPPTTAARIRARWQADPTTTNDMSDVNFTIAPATVRVAIPNTAINVRIASTQNVRVSHNLGAGQVLALELTRNNGLSWDPIGTVTTGAGVNANFAWVVDGPPTTQARIRATWATNPAVTDQSNVNFTILERITVTTPNTNVNWVTGAPNAITWAHNLGLGAQVNIDVSRDGGNTWTRIATNIASATDITGTFSWSVTGPATTTARVRITSATDPSIQDVSNVDFSITLGP